MSEQTEPDAQTPQLSYNISSENFEAVIRDLHLPAEQQELIRWWWFHGREEGLTLGVLAKRAGVDASTLSRVFRGVYHAGLDGVCAKLAKARLTLADRVDNPDYIETSLARQVFAVCDRSRALVNVALLWGDMGIGKTTVAEEYRRLNNHGRTIYHRCGSRQTFAQFVAHLAVTMGVTNIRRRQSEVRHRIIKVMKAGQRLLIIDELHQLFITSRAGAAVEICEFLREIHDVAKCGLVLIGTKVMKTEFVSGNHKEALAQLLDRGTIQIELPNKPTKGDLKAFLKHYRLPDPAAADPDAAAIVADILKSSGLRKLTLHLRDGLLFANKANARYTWTHFVQAFEDIRSLGSIV